MMIVEVDGEWNKAYLKINFCLKIFYLLKGYY